MYLLSSLLSVAVLLLPHLHSLTPAPNNMITANFNNASSDEIERQEQSSTPSSKSDQASRAAAVTRHNPDVTHDGIYGAKMRAAMTQTSGMRYRSSRSSRQMMMPGGILPAIGAILAIGKVIGLKATLIKKMAVAGGAGNNNNAPPIITQVLAPGQAPLTGPFASGDRDVINIRYRKVKGSSQSLQKIPMEDVTAVGNETMSEVADDSSGIEIEKEESIALSLSSNERG